MPVALPLIESVLALQDFATHILTEDAGHHTFDLS